MAGRPTKQGIDYFPIDVGFFNDIKIRKISRACGPHSTSILICLLCNIYKDNGYYILWDEDMPFVIADTVGVSEGAVKEVILKAVQVEFFSKEKFEEHKILTSAGVQKRFFLATYQRKETDIIKEYIIDCANNPINCANNSINHNDNEQSKVKVKRNNNTPSPPKTGGVGRKKKNESGLNSKARILFEKHYKDIFSADYYWTAKDAGNMTDLLSKLKFQRQQKNLPLSDDDILSALQYLLGSIKEGWIFNNFSVCVINSKFNEIVAQLRNEQNKLKKQERADTIVWDDSA